MTSIPLGIILWFSKQYHHTTPIHEHPPFDNGDTITIQGGSTHPTKQGTILYGSKGPFTALTAHSRWGRTGFDRAIGSVGGVPWLVSGPRKKLTTNLIAENNLAMAA